MIFKIRERSFHKIFTELIVQAPSNDRHLLCSRPVEVRFIAIILERWQKGIYPTPTVLPQQWASNSAPGNELIVSVWLPQLQFKRLFTKFTTPPVIPPQLRAHFLRTNCAKKKRVENCKRFICNNVWCTISCRNIYVLLCGPVLRCPTAGFWTHALTGLWPTTILVAIVQLFNRKNKENGGTQLARMNAIYGPCSLALVIPDQTIFSGV